MKRYVVTMKHDDGVVRIHTAASSADAAVWIVLKAELAPPSAVQSVKEEEW